MNDWGIAALTIALVFLFAVGLEVLIIWLTSRGKGGQEWDR